MKLLVVGGSGLVGAHVVAAAVSAGHEVIATYRSHPGSRLRYLDLADDKAAAALLGEIRPDWVVHAAGWTWVDGCERDPARAFRENCEQPLMLAKLCRQSGARFLYYSTTYVFDGCAGPYSEEDVPNPVNVYASSKWLAEQSIQDVLDDAALIPRLICVWGYEPQQKNFTYQALKAITERRVLPLPADQLGNPTWAGDIAEWSLKLMESNSEGVWNLASDLCHCARTDWFQAIWRGAYAAGLAAGSTCEYVGLTTRALAQTAPRPLNTSAKIEKLSAVLPVYKPRRPHEIDPILGNFVQ